MAGSPGFFLQVPSQSHMNLQINPIWKSPQHCHKHTKKDLSYGLSSGFVSQW
ncbi:hypothetical protein PAXRUDRAFT_20163 [Paxillus rubicundulus Ve08.2h10]|uniref:Uncharacterized protein n=1 Tax=Paxillus rubicundulus Ve08.2h10 TaxID=930991 RepID=A0A0D0D2K6_9AGAM|nr:hypothetical protein PAXRUDRAFT_20163 [Paxillus rubicundulus Ve08.2h10]